MKRNEIGITLIALVITKVYPSNKNLNILFSKPFYPSQSIHPKNNLKTHKVLLNT